VRLLVPTAKMAAHHAMRLAREGLVVRPSLIQTLWRLYRRWVTIFRKFPIRLRTAGESTGAGLNLPAFTKVADFRGFTPCWRARSRIVSEKKPSSQTVFSSAVPPCRMRAAARRRRSDPAAQMFAAMRGSPRDAPDERLA